MIGNVAGFQLEARMIPALQVYLFVQLSSCADRVFVIVVNCIEYIAFVALHLNCTLGYGKCRRRTTHSSLIKTNDVVGC